MRFFYWYLAYRAAYGPRAAGVMFLLLLLLVGLFLFCMIGVPVPPMEGVR